MRGECRISSRQGCIDPVRSQAKLAGMAGRRTGVPAQVFCRMRQCSHLGEQEQGSEQGMTNKTDCGSRWRDAKRFPAEGKFQVSHGA